MNFPNILRLLLSPKSLSRGLFARMILVTFLAALAIFGIARTAVRDEIDQIFDQQLVLGANLLVNLMREELTGLRKTGPSPVLEVDDMPLLSDEDREAFDAYADWRMFRIWYDGHLQLKSDTGPDLSPPKAADTSTFRVVKVNDQSWRIYTLSGLSGNTVVQVGERLGVRDQVVRNIALELAAPYIGIAIVLLVLIWVSLRSGLKDLDGFSARLAQQRGRPPFVSVRPEDWPAELGQLTIVINSLFRRIEDGLQHERTFTEMAAHQLRTPLAALSLEAQLCARIDDPLELKQRLLALNTATTRIAKLAEQLLVLARSGAVEEADAELSLHSIIGQLLAEVAPVIAQRRIDIALEGDNFTVRGSETALRLALSNLIENALFYTDQASEVVIRLSVDAAGQYGVIEVRDQGPGLAAEDMEKAFNRFWRAPTNKSNGTGLGLAIAREAAERLGGQVSLHNRGDGRAGLVAILTVPLIFFSH